MQRENLTRFGLMFMLLVLLAVPAARLMAADQSTLPQRSDIEDKYKWKVEDIYPNVDAWEKDFLWAKQQLTAFEPYRDHLDDSPEMLLAALKLSDSVDIVVSNLYVYAYLKLDEDNRQGTYQELAGRVSTLNSQLAEATSFIQPEMIAIGKEKLESCLYQNKYIDVYRF